MKKVQRKKIRLPKRDLLNLKNFFPYKLPTIPAKGSAIPKTKIKYPKSFLETKKAEINIPIR